MRTAILLLALAAVAPGDRHGPYQRCVECKADCRASKDRKECELSCYRAKASDCRRSGFGPGPKGTCDCT